MTARATTIRHRCGHISTFTLRGNRRVRRAAASDLRRARCQRCAGKRE